MATRYRDEKDEFMNDSDVIMGVLGDLAEVQEVDFDAMAGKIISAVKDAYPINGVPDDAVKLTADISSSLGAISGMLDALILLVQGVNDEG